MMQTGFPIAFKYLYSKNKLHKKFLDLVYTDYQELIKWLLVINQELAELFMVKWAAGSVELNDFLYIVPYEKQNLSVQLFKIWISNHHISSKDANKIYDYIFNEVIDLPVLDRMNLIKICLDKGLEYSSVNELYLFKK